MGILVKLESGLKQIKTIFMQHNFFMDNKNTFKFFGYLNVAIGKGKIYGFLWSNGAGKTTTTQILVTLLSQNSKSTGF